MTNPLGEEFKHCNEEGCPEKIKNHAWGHIKAGGEGWFQQQDGTIWCPKHVPDWVEEWRKRKAREKEALARGDSLKQFYIDESKRKKKR